jgi:hypothetical protein
MFLRPLCIRQDVKRQFVLGVTLNEVKGLAYLEKARCFARAQNDNRMSNGIYAAENFPEVRDV